MKTSRIILIVALITFCSLTYAQTEIDRKHLSVSITLKLAIKNPGLVHAMYEQLNQDFLHGPIQRVYHVKLEYKKCTYDIYGSYEEWRLFFLMDNNCRIPVNSPAG